MTADEYRTLRLLLGLTQRELADLLDCHVQTIKVREGGATIRREAEYALRHLELLLAGDDEREPP